jgi:hypothetical protein
MPENMVTCAQCSTSGKLINNLCRQRLARRKQFLLICA